jgi:Tol biopolymer transport system component
LGQEIVTRRVPVPDELYATSVSYDGRYLSSGWYDPGIVALYGLESGEIEELTVPPDPASSAFPDRSHASRDGEWVAYTTWNGRGWDLRVVARGGEPRVLFEGDYYYPTDWSPDGQVIVAPVERQVGRYDIVLVSVSDGTQRVLKRFDTRWPAAPRMSPDGRYVAYDLPVEERSRNRDIWIVSEDGSREERVVDSPATDLLLGWLSDGSGLLFQSDREGIPGWWLLPVADGQRSGPPVLVQSEMWGDPVPIGFTNAGAFYYTVTVGRRELFVGGFDASTAELTGTPRRVSGNHRLRGGVAWSPDGEQLAFVAREGRPEYGSGGDKIVIWSAATSELREISPDFFTIGKARWAPDSRSLLVAAVAAPVSGDQGLYRVDAQTGATTALMVGEWPRHFALTRDGKTAYYHRRGNAIGVVALDVETGQITELYGDPNDGPGTEFDMTYAFGGLQLSHDESTLLLRSYASDVVLTLPVTGGTPRLVLRLEEGERAVGLRWADDDASAFVTTRRITDEAINLWRFSLQDGTKEHVARCVAGVDPAPCHGQISPDGRHIAFGAGEEKDEMWVASGFPRADSGSGSFWRR